MEVDMPVIETQRAILLDVLQALAAFGRKRRASRKAVAGMLAAENNAEPNGSG